MELIGTTNLNELSALAGAIGFEYIFVDQYFVDHLLFLENYDIYKQFQALQKEKVNLSDFDCHFAMYMLEAELFLNQHTIFLLDKSSLPANAAFFQQVETYNGVFNLYVDAQFDLKNLPMLPQEYFLTQIIPTNDGAKDVSYCENVSVFINTLPDGLVPVELNDNLQLEVYQHLTESEGLVVDEKGLPISKGALYIDLEELFKFEEMIKIKPYE